MNCSYRVTRKIGFWVFPVGARYEELFYIMKKEKKINWGIIVSIAFSIAAIIISCLRVWHYDLSDASYISIITTLMGICATFIVCFQIYSGYEMNRRIYKIEKIEEEISKWETLKFESEGNFELSKAFLYQNRECYDQAFNCYHTALYNYLTINKGNKIEDTLVNLENCANLLNDKKQFIDMQGFESMLGKIESLDSSKPYKRRLDNIENLIKYGRES